MEQFSFIQILATTILKRPYVFLFLLSYLFIAKRVTNTKWTIKYLIAGYTIAFLSEYCSINYGFPYGWYHYIYENLQGEWLNHGVPVWDSVSYTFMNFSGLCAAQYAIRHNTLSKIKLLFLSAFLVTLLDVITDPLAHMGEQWFLGKIYYYPNPGWYFDVTFANFIGWYITSLAINGVGIFLLGFTEQVKLKGFNTVLALGLYYGIFAFSFLITIYLQQWLLVFCDLFWIGLTIIIIFRTDSLSNFNRNML